MARDLWFTSLHRLSRKGLKEDDKAVIGILTYEVATLMSSVVKLWHCLSDKEFHRMKEEIANLIGIRKLVSDDEHYLMELILKEIIENLRCLARSTARFGNRCKDSVYHHFEQFIKDPVENDFDLVGWEYKWKKMERKVKKMERFVAVTTQLSEELEVLAELEQTLRRMRVNPEFDRVKLLEFQQKVMWQREEVKNLRAMSPWNRTYDYTVRLLMRSILTLVERIKCVFGVNELPYFLGENIDRKLQSPVFPPRCYSFSSALQLPVHPSEKDASGFYSGPLRRLTQKSELLADWSRSRIKQIHHSPLNSTQFSQVGFFKGCIERGTDSPVLYSCQPISSGSLRLSGTFVKNAEKVESKGSSSGSFFFHSKSRLLNAPPSTLGNAALAVHYANVIILIEKLVSSPHLIGLDARDDLYNMLPRTIRTALRAKLKSYAKRTLPSSVYDHALAAEWDLAISGILEWLSPLAHNMIRWHSERDVEKQYLGTGTCVLLVQTLYYAIQEKTEAAIVELLVGLNYICRSSGELYWRDLTYPAGIRGYHNYLHRRDELGF